MWKSFSCINLLHGSSAHGYDNYSMTIVPDKQFGNSFDFIRPKVILSAFLSSKQVVGFRKSTGTYTLCLALTARGLRKSLNCSIVLHLNQHFSGKVFSSAVQVSYRCDPTTPSSLHKLKHLLLTKEINSPILLNILNLQCDETDTI